MAWISTALRKQVRERAQDRCEYCQLAEKFYRSSFQPDHIIAECHKGRTIGSNLCWACFHCNLHKGTNLAGIDPKTGKKAWLFNPRRMKWNRHFRWDGPILLGRTATGRVTIQVLCINDDEIVQVRIALIDEGVFPPT